MVMTSGFWVLYLVLSIGKNDVVLKPYKIYESQLECLTMQNIYERELDVKMSCSKQKEASKELRKHWCKTR